MRLFFCVSVAVFAAVSVTSAGDDLEIRLGPAISSLSPTDQGYIDRFMTPGVSYGVMVDLKAPGPIVFLLGFEKFYKSASEDWDGEVDAVIISSYPCFSLPIMTGFSVHTGPGVVFIDGSYSGTDDFGSFTKADGSSVGFGLTAGADVFVWGPMLARLDFRRVFMDMKTDRAIIDGTESVVYPAAETDLGYSQFSLSIMISLFGGEGSVF